MTLLGGSMREHRKAPSEYGPGDAIADAIWLLNDPLRLALLALLVQGETSVGDLTKRVGWPQSQVSEALGEFKRAEWVRYEQDGRYHLYRLSGTPHVRLESSHLVVDLIADHGNRLVMVRTYGLRRPSPVLSGMVAITEPAAHGK